MRGPWRDLRHGQDRRSGRRCRWRFDDGAEGPVPSKPGRLRRSLGLGHPGQGPRRQNPDRRRTAAHEHCRGVRAENRPAGPACRAVDHAVAVRDRPDRRRGGWPADDHGTDAVPWSSAPDPLVGNVALAARLAPAIGAQRVIRTWTGMNTTAGGSSIIDRLPGAERVVMAVPGDAGYTLAPPVARMAASIVTGRGPLADPTPCSPARFAA